LTDLSAGASAAEKLLRGYSDPHLNVLVIWEPILPTDWISPSGSTLARISDPRARQSWDPKHIVSQELERVAQQHPGAEGPPCCKHRGFYWDDVIFYAPRGSHDVGLRKGTAPSEVKE
jgi:hypothetical protein